MQMRVTWPAVPSTTSSRSGHGTRPYAGRVPAMRAAGPAGQSVPIQWLRRRAALDRTVGSRKVLASSAVPS